MEGAPAGREGEALVRGHEDILDLHSKEVPFSGAFDVDRTGEGVGRGGPGAVDPGAIQGGLAFLPQRAAGGVFGFQDEILPRRNLQFRRKGTVESVNLGLVS
jgi:hypothetical protein